MECDSRATLEETLRLLQELPLHPRRVGERAIAFPACELDAVRQALEARQCFPRVLHSQVPQPSDEEA